MPNINRLMAGRQKTDLTLESRLIGPQPVRITDGVVVLREEREGQDRERELRRDTEFTPTAEPRKEVLPRDVGLIEACDFTGTIAGSHL